MLRQLLICCILVGITTALQPLSILLVQPVMSTSHHVWTMTLVKELLRRGHHVHLVSIHKANVGDKLAQNLTSAVFDDVINDLKKQEDYEPGTWRDFSVYKTINFLYDWGCLICEKIIATNAAKELLKTIKNVEFDVIVQDITLTECLHGIWEVAKGKPPVVGFLPFGPATWLKDYVGDDNYPSVRPFMGSNIIMPDGLWQRTWNTFYFFVDHFIRHYHYLPKIQSMAERYIGHQIRPLHEIAKTVSIVLVNTHPTFEPGIPLPANVLEIAGMHAQYSQSIADERIRNFLDEATDGAVVISLGTNVAWKSVGLDKLKAVILALSKLKERVLWKLKDKVPLQMPNNVMAVEWIPQSDVLTHKNVKAIWTHGGLLSTHEAVWRGIPVIGMPFFMDQRPNVEMLVSKGVGVRLDVDNLTTESILDAFKKVLHDESIIQNMKQLSNAFRDRLVPPLDLAVWSIEYAFRHPPGTLASPIKSQSWIERNLIDIYLILFVSLIVILLTIYLAAKIFSFYYHHVYVTSKRKSKQT